MFYLGYCLRKKAVNLMRIRLRMIFTLSLLIGLMGSQVFITLGMLSHLTFSFSAISQKHLVQIERINQINQKLFIIMADPAGFQNSGNVPETRDMASIETTINNFKKDYDGSPEKLNSLQENYQDFKKNLNLYKQQIRNGLPPGGNTLASLQDSYFHFLLAVNSLRDSAIQQVRDTISSNYLMVKQAFYLLLIALSLVSVIGIIFGWYVARSFSRGLNALQEAIHNARHGDLSHPARWNYDDEFGHLAKSFNDMITSLQKSRQEMTRHYQQALETRDERIQILEEQLEEARTGKTGHKTELQKSRPEMHEQTGHVLTKDS